MPAGIRRVLRDPLRVITLLLWLVIVSTVAVAVWVLIELMNTPPSAQALQNAPAWVTQWLVPFAQGQLRLLMPIVFLFGVIVILLLSALTLKFHKADKFSVVRIEFRGARPAAGCGTEARGADPDRHWLAGERS